MLVKRTSAFSGKLNVVEIPITEYELTIFDMTGVPPSNLKTSQIRFLTNGSTDEEYQQMIDELDAEDDTDPNRRYHR